jgi:hypothetical protein
MLRSLDKKTFTGGKTKNHGINNFFHGHCFIFKAQLRWCRVRSSEIHKFRPTDTTCISLLQPASKGRQMNYSENSYIQLFQQQNFIISEKNSERQKEPFRSMLSHSTTHARDPQTLLSFMNLLGFSAAWFTVLYFTSLSCYVFCWLTFCLLLYWFV